MMWGLAVLISILGMWVSFDLTLAHLKIPEKDRQGGSSLARMCGVAETASCEAVLESPWARIPFGAPKDKFSIPTASLGLAFFTAVAAWLVMIGWVSPQRWWVHLVFVGVLGFGLGVSIYLEYIMWTKLPKWCPLCLTTHVASLLLFVFGLLLWPRAPKAAAPPVVVAPGVATTEAGASLFAEGEAAALPSDAAAPWPTAWTLAMTPVVAAVSVAAVVLLVLAMANAKKARDIESVNKAYGKAYDRYDNRAEHTFLAWQLAPQLDIPTQGRPAKGPADARHTVVIFSDFQCPACKKIEDWFNRSVFPTSRSPMTGGIRVVFKHWPINIDCNSFVTREKNLHPAACEAAWAAEAAYALGGDEAFWKMHDLLFATQEEWKSSRNFAALARQIGLNEQAFAAAMKSDAVRQRVQADIADGANLAAEQVRKGALTEDEREYIKVNGTPAIFVNGKRLYSPQHIDTWNAITGYQPRNRRPAGTTTQPGVFIPYSARTLGLTTTAPAR